MNINRKKRQVELESAILSLKSLLEKKQNIEEKYQKLFEKNPIIFDILGYKNFWAFTKNSKKSLPRDQSTGKEPEPDFIVERKDGLFEIFELKTPISKKILVTFNKYRERFTSEVSSYISQVIDYHKYFINPVNRKKVNNMLGVNLQENLNSKIVIGLRKDLDMKKIDEQIKNSVHRIEIIPFDNILDQLVENYNNEFGHYENLPGISFHNIVRFHKDPTASKNYFLAIGDKDSDYISIFIENDELNVVFNPKNGRTHIKSIPKVGRLYLSRWIYFSFELGIRDKTLFFSINLNGKEIGREEETFENKININLNSLLLGCNIDQTEFGIFDDYEKCLYSQTLTLNGRYQLFKYFSGKLKKIQQFIQFNGSKFMYRDITGNLVQNDPKFAPIFRKI